MTRSRPPRAGPLGPRRSGRIPPVRPTVRSTGRPGGWIRSVRKHPWCEQCTTAQGPGRTITAPVAGLVPLGQALHRPVGGPRRTPVRSGLSRGPTVGPRRCARRRGARPGSRPGPRARAADVPGRHQPGVATGGLPVAVDVAGHHGGPCGHRLEQDHAERLPAQRRRAEHVGPGQPSHLLLLGQDSEPVEVGRLGMGGPEGGRSAGRHPRSTGWAPALPSPAGPRPSPVAGTRTPTAARRDPSAPRAGRGTGRSAPRWARAPRRRTARPPPR